MTGGYAGHSVPLLRFEKSGLHRALLMLIEHVATLPAPVTAPALNGNVDELQLAVFTWKTCLWTL